MPYRTVDATSRTGLFLGTIALVPGVTSSTSLDAFGRLRVSGQVPLFDSTHIYDLNPLWWETITTGGSCVHDANAAAAVLSTGGGTSGNFCIRQTYQYFHYQPGKGQLVTVTGYIEHLTRDAMGRVALMSAMSAWISDHPRPSREF